MAVVIGVKQQIKTYQIMQENNNYVNINNKLSSNLIYLNNDIDTFSNASIIFRNNYEFGYINDKITIYNNQSNIFTADNNNINLYKNTQFHSNININDYFYTSNNINYFKNNIKLNLNDNINNSFEISYNNNSPVLQVFKENVYFKSSNIYTSNIYVDPNSTIYTNFIDSPNLKPVIIKNMAFAESLRLLSANIIQNISIDNNIIFANLTDYKPGTPNISTYAPSNALLWTQYMKNNNINQTDPFFIRPNISILKYVDQDQNAVIGGSNIVEFKTSKLATSSISTLVHSVNNFGYISIGSNYNHDIPLKIKISPFSSNIIEYTNINDINNKCCCINSNGFLNIGSITPVTRNQLTINKYSNIDNFNTDLISLNINTSQFSSNIGTITIPFINNDIYTNFIFDTFISGSTLNLYITNKFIKNNILTNNLNATLYEDSQYSSSTFPGVITIIIKLPKNVFNIIKKDPDNIFVIYPNNIITEPNYLNTVEFNKITITKTILDQTVNLFLYIYKQTYNYNYTGKYYPEYTNFITCSNNDKNSFSLSSTGNIGIGTNYIDTFNLFTSNALITDISCKSIDNFPLKSISLCNCSINNIDAIYNASFISTCNLICSSNISSNILNNNCIINSNLSVLGSNNGTMKINAKTIYNGDNQFNDYFISIYGSNAIAINNNIINKHPNILINSTCANSYPFLTLKNTSNTYNISINSNNNFQITNNSNISIIQNNYQDNNINILDTSLCVFKDVNSNVKIFMGTNTSRVETYYSYISGIGKNPAIKSSINTYGNLNFCDSSENPIINSYYDTNNKLRIGIGTINNDTDANGMVVNLSTLFSSNITAKRNILLEGTILSISDSNLKTDIKKIINPLDKISQISGYTYKRKDTSNIETGLLAQEVINILPEVVKYENNHYNISYGNMCGLLVECIKELNNKIGILENKLASSLL
jgi:hypothetical protein